MIIVILNYFSGSGDRDCLFGFCVICCVVEGCGGWEGGGRGKGDGGGDDCRAFCALHVLVVVATCDVVLAVYSRVHSCTVVYGLVQSCTVLYSLVQSCTVLYGLVQSEPVTVTQQVDDVM